MNIEHLLIYILYTCGFISLAYIPKNNRREASIIFLFQQTVTWLAGALAVQFNLLEYPIRELAKVNSTSFLYEFFLYPIITIFFCLYYPKNRPNWRKIFYLSIFSTALSVPEIFFEKYTHLIEYLNWHWYYSWASVYTTLFLAWIFYKWYFKLNND